MDNPGSLIGVYVFILVLSLCYFIFIPTVILFIIMFCLFFFLQWKLNLSVLHSQPFLVVKNSYDLPKKLLRAIHLISLLLCSQCINIHFFFCKILTHHVHYGPGQLILIVSCFCMDTVGSRFCFCFSLCFVVDIVSLLAGYLTFISNWYSSL